MKNVIKSLAKSVLTPLGLTAGASAADAGIHKKNLRIWSPSFFLLCFAYYNTNNIMMKWKAL